jgi:tRNA uridine 5-carboxymethylaminomethyl modification enzyme
LLLRHDNADLRLTELGRRIGLVSDERYRRFVAKKERLEAEARRLEETVARPEEWAARGLPGRLNGPQALVELLRRPEVHYRDLVSWLAAAGGGMLGAEEAAELEAEVKYAGYLHRQEEQVRRMQRLEELHLPGGLDYQQVRGLSREGLERLTAVRPASVAQAARIPGVSPADIAVLLVYLEKERRERRVGS